MAATFEIKVPNISNRSVLIETTTDFSDWHLWDVPNNTPQFPATSGGMKTITGTRDGNARFFRATYSTP
jgi:hypothetical protein